MSPSPEPTLVILQGVVARDAAGPRGAARGSLQSMSAHLGPGVHAFLGAPEDGTIALTEVIAGLRKPLRGVALVHSESPFQSAPIRSTIGALLPSPDLPEARTVTSAVEAALIAMGRVASEAPAVLEAIGIAPLAPRPTRSLSFAESRAVELSLALFTARALAKRAAPPVLVLHEPYAEVAVPSIQRVLDDAIAELRPHNACVILVTSSPADARRLGDTLWLLQKGAVLRRERGDGGALVHGDVEIAAWVGADASASLRALAASVCAHPAVRAATWDDPGQGTGRPAVLRVRGADRDACALAILDAAASAGVAIEAITTSSPDLATVRSASIAWVQRMRTAQRPPPRPVTPPAEKPPQAAPAEPAPSAETPPQAPLAEPAPPVEDVPTAAPLATPDGEGTPPDATPPRPPEG